MRKWLSVGVGLGLVGLGGALVGLAASTPVSADPNHFGGPGHCRPDPSAAIAAGGVWNGDGKCYNLRDGVTISAPVTVENATFYDAQSRPRHTSGVLPILRVKDTSDVNLSSLTLLGTNYFGVFRPDLVGEAGIDILSSDHVTIANVTTVDTYGDGLTLGFQPQAGPSTNLIVNGLTVVNAGRDGVTSAYLTGASMTNVNIVSSARPGWDFESDLPGVGSGNVVVSRAKGNGVRFVEYLSGPITFANSLISGNIALIGAAAGSRQPVVFNGGTILQDASFHGTPPAGVWIRGPGRLTLDNVILGRKPSRRAPTGLAWLALDGATLTLDGGVQLPPLGRHDATSTVSISS
jgi:hypothetical protein